MGIMDSLTGKTYSLNTVIKPAMKEIQEASQSFPEKDFMRDYFLYLWYACNYFVETAFEIDAESNTFKKNIKKITPYGAKSLCKLIAFHVNSRFLSNSDNVEFIQELGLTPEILQNYVNTTLDYTSSDFALFLELIELQNADEASYSIEWVKAFNNLVMGKTETPPIDEVLLIRELLKQSYVFFMHSFNK